MPPEAVTPTAPVTTTAATGTSTENVATPVAAAAVTPPAPTETPAPQTTTPAAASVVTPEPVKPAEPAKPVEPVVPKAVVPDKYELKIPQGSRLDPARVDEISALAKEKGLSNEQAQLILDREHNSVEKFVETQLAAADARKAEYLAETTSDKEIGGANVNENITLAHRVVKQFASEKFLAELESTGLGNYSEVVRVFARIGKAFGEDRLVQAPAQRGAGKSTADVLFDKTPSNT